MSRDPGIAITPDPGFLPSLWSSQDSIYSDPGPAQEFWGIFCRNFSGLVCRRLQKQAVTPDFHLGSLAESPGCCTVVSVEHRTDGATVRAERQRLALSQYDLAALAGVSQAYLSKFERGAACPSARWLRDVNDALVVAKAARSAA